MPWLACAGGAKHRPALAGHRARHILPTAGPGCPSANSYSQVSKGPRELASLTGSAPGFPRHSPRALVPLRKFFMVQQLQLLLLGKVPGLSSPASLCPRCSADLSSGVSASSLAPAEQAKPAHLELWTLSDSKPTPQALSLPCKQSHRRHQERASLLLCPTGIMGRMEGLFSPHPPLCSCAPQP